MTKAFIFFLASIFFTAYAANAPTDAINYECKRSTVDIRTIELDGHKFIVAVACGKQLMGAYVGTGTSISILHSPGCPCQQSK